ncbi:TIGR03085 family protein [Amycolatopsis antarctica]|uniref:TIGR03085 family protein n=1 Tax=Amycolatopsis antarctica TaxID=1854586 RepID=A0A263D7I5_9PSEU|nr:TIGR03085 family metal-binding protein [Amycolatopsis antarctica]OZM73365.1 TIGR03085 family protein [Amycolatopsis antarctica]
MGVAKDERLALCALFDMQGPKAPTLCAGWTTRDLAAHLVLRERRPDALPGILVGPLAGYTQRVQDGYAAKPWDALVELVRTGPPRLAPTSLGFVDELVNSAEFLVHHEDVRRARQGWQPRPAQEDRDKAAWGAVSRIGKLAFRRSPVGVVLGVPGRSEVTAKRGSGQVIVRGEPVELLLYAFGRDEVELSFEGDKSALDGVSRGL